jgi:hypothetical protein
MLLKSVDELNGDLDSSDANLASFCQQVYPQYCIRFVVAADAASGGELVQRLQRLAQQFPQRDIQTVSAAELDQLIGRCRKARSGSRQANPPQIWVLVEGNVCVEPDYLAQMVQPFRAPSVGLVSGVRTRHLSPWKNRFATLRSIERYGRALVMRDSELMTGSSLAIRADLLAKLAGADYWPASSFSGSLSGLMETVRCPDCWPMQWTTLGYRMALSTAAVERASQPQSKSSGWQQALNQQINGARAQRLACPKRYLQQGLSYGTLYGLLLLWLMQSQSLFWGWITAGWITAGCTWLAEFVMLCGLGGCLQIPSVWRLGWLLPLNSLMGFGIWVCGFGGGRAASSGASDSNRQPVAVSAGLQPELQPEPAANYTAPLSVR